MADFEDLYKALYGIDPPSRRPKPAANLSSFLRAAQPPTPKPGFVRTPLSKAPGFIRTNPSKTPLFVRAIKPKVFVSFDYENDRLYKQALDMWDANKRFQFTFQSHTPTEIQSDDISRIKAGLTLKVKEATHVIVIVGRYANQPHPDRLKIGFRNWINFEVYQARYYKKKNSSSHA
jgi:hypothetical protein